VPVLPRISNHRDFDPLRLYPQVNLQFVDLSETPPLADLIILPVRNPLVLILLPCVIMGIGYFAAFALWWAFIGNLWGGKCQGKVLVIH